MLILGIYTVFSLCLAVWCEYLWGSTADDPMYRACHAIGFAVLWPVYVAWEICDRAGVRFRRRR